MHGDDVRIPGLLGERGAVGGRQAGEADAVFFRVDGVGQLRGELGAQSRVGGAVVVGV